MSRSDYITIEKVWEITDNGRLVFQEELGKIPNKPINSPLRVDRKASFKVFKADNGLWMYKDFSTDDSDTAIGFLMKKYNLSYREAINKIKTGIQLNSVNSGLEKIKTEKEGVNIEFVDKPFTKEGHQYWNSFCLNEDFLRKDNIFQVKIYKIGEKVVKPPENQQVFCYWAEDIDKVKLLTIGKDVKHKWISNIKNSYLWFYYQYKEPIKDFFLVKSVKDRMVLKLLGYKGISLQNESATTFLKSNIDNIEKICKTPIICMGSDTQGFQTSLDITKATGYRWFNTKKYMLKFGVNDPASFCKEFSLELLDKQIKKDLQKWK